MCERLLVYFGLLKGAEAPREDRPPVDRAVGLRRERLGLTVRVIWFVVWGALWFVQADTTFLKIAGVVVAAAFVYWAGREIVGTRPTKRSRGLSDPLAQASSGGRAARRASRGSRPRRSWACVE